MDGRARDGHEAARRQGNPEAAAAESPIARDTGLGRAVIQRKLAQRWQARGGPLQRRAAAPDANAAVPTSLAPAGGGSGLAAPVQHQMEDAFGADFSSVRVHEGEHAGAIGAQAFTQGEDVHFAPGQYDPSSQRGQALIGHELTHVVQQRAGLVATPQGKGGEINADPALEAEADTQGERAARGEAVSVSGAGAGIQRRADGSGGAIQCKGEFERLRASEPDRAAALQAQAEAEYHRAVAEFDRNVGRALADHPRSHAGADVLLTRMRALIETYAAAISDQEEQQHEVVAKSFGVRSKKVIRSPGATRRDYDAVMAVLDDLDGANLRQKMGMVYVAITNGGLATALDHMRTSLRAEAAAAAPPGADPSPYHGLGMDTDYLLGAEMDDRYAKLGDQKPTRALFARSPVVTGANNDRTGQDDMSPAEKKEQDKKARANRMTPAELAADKSRLPLSLGELESIYPKQATEIRARLAAEGGAEPAPEAIEAALMAEVGGKKLKWEAGETTYKIRDGSSVKQRADQLKVMLRAGLSGSTDMYLHAARHFKLTDAAALQDIRCAALGSMIPEHDHSFYEIMIASTAYGMDYVPGPAGYGAFQPFSAADVQQMAKLAHLPAYYLDDYLDQLASGAPASSKPPASANGGADPGAVAPIPRLVVPGASSAAPVSGVAPVGPGGAAPIPDAAGAAAAINLFFDPDANHYSYLIPPGVGGGPFLELEVAGDGACLFHACAKALEAELRAAGKAPDQKSVRAIVARELKDGDYRERIGTAIADIATIIRAGRAPAGVSATFLAKLKPVMATVNAELDAANDRHATDIGGVPLGFYANRMYERLVDDYIDAVKLNTNMWGGQLEIEALAGATGRNVNVVSPGEKHDGYDRKAIVPGAADRTVTPLGADAVMRTDEQAALAKVAALPAVDDDAGPQVAPFPEAAPVAPGPDVVDADAPVFGPAPDPGLAPVADAKAKKVKAKKAKPKSAGEKVLDEFDQSTTGVDYSDRDAWSGITTDPKKHDPEEFQYFIHGAKATARILDPSRLESTFLSTSLVDQDHMGVYFPSGMILEVPPQCIVVAGPADLGIGNKNVGDKDLLAQDISDAADRADTASRVERAQQVRRQTRQERYQAELDAYNNRKAAWDAVQAKRLAMFRKKPPKPGAAPAAPKLSGVIEPESIEEQKAFNTAYRDSIQKHPVPVKLLDPDDLMAQASPTTHTEVSVLGHTADQQHRVRTVGFFVVVFSDDEIAAVNAGTQPSTISAKHWAAIQKSAAAHKLPIVALKYDRDKHGAMTSVGDPAFEAQTKAKPGDGGAKDKDAKDKDPT